MSNVIHETKMNAFWYHGTNMNDLDLCLEVVTVVSRSRQPLRYIYVEYLGNR